MELEALVVQNTITKRVMTLLRDNPGRSYTAKELADEQPIFGSNEQIRKSVDLLLKQWVVKVKSRGSELCYQFIPAQKK